MTAASEKGRRGTTVATPANLKLLEGRGNGRDSGGREVKPPPPFKRLAPEPPDFLAGEALDEWRRVVPELQRLELTKPLDRASLTAYCLTWQRLCQAQLEVARDGVLSTNSQGVVRHPAVAVVEAASKELRAWAHEFGLTPASEANVSSGGDDGAEDENPFAG